VENWKMKRKRKRNLKKKKAFVLIVRNFLKKNQFVDFPTCRVKYFFWGQVGGLVIIHKSNEPNLATGQTVKYFFF